MKAVKVVFVFSCLFLFLLSSCGLDTYYYLEPPVTTGTTTYNNSDNINDYFSFYTNEESDNNSQYTDGDSTFTLLGTDVYYRIYNNYSSLTSITSTISSLLSSTTSTVSTYDRITETYNYQPLVLSSGSYSTLVPVSGHSRYVYLRLNDLDPDAYRAAVCVDGDSSYSLWTNHGTYYDAAAKKDSSGNHVYPLRNIYSSGEGYKTFNFGGDGYLDYEPEDGDDDYLCSSTADADDTWYIDLYAVTVGFDTETFEMSYSQVLHLGSITVTSGQYTSKTRTTYSEDSED